MNKGKNFLFDPNDPGVRKYEPKNVKARRFNQGTEVQYTGEQFASILNNRKGVIDGFVDGTERGVSVTFEECNPDDRHYIMDEVRDLEEWKGKTKEFVEKADKKLKVEARKGIAKSKRNNQEEG